MKRLFLNFISLAMFISIATSCIEDKKDSESGGEFTGSYSGTLKVGHSFVGVWTCKVDANGNITVSVLDGNLISLSGSVSDDGTFTTKEDGGTASAILKGKIDNGGEVTGTYEGGSIAEMSEVNGGEGNGGLDYVGTWYENSDDIIYSKMVMTESTYAIYMFDEISGEYDLSSIDDGTFDIDGNDISVYPSNGINESGKIFVSGETLIISLISLSPMVYEKTDSNPNAQ